MYFGRTSLEAADYRFRAFVLKGYPTNHRLIGRRPPRLKCTTTRTIFDALFWAGAAPKTAIFLNILVFSKSPLEMVELLPMNRITLGLLCGLAFGLLDAAVMLPMSFPDKKVAITGAFLDRFAIGFLTCVVDLPFAGWLAGLVVALLISLPSAVISKTYAPILGTGAIGGIIIGILKTKLSR
jgi:hypothetical protein